MNDVESEVVARFGAAFPPENLQDLDGSTVADVRRRNMNHHWYGLERNNSRMTADMPALREGMAVCQGT